MKRIRLVILLALAFLSARCEFLGGMFPFGIALLTVCGESLTYLYIGAVLGALSIDLSFGGMLLNVMPYALLLPLLLGFKKHRDRLFVQMIFACSVFFVPAIILDTDEYIKIVWIFTGLSAACFVPLIKRLYLSFLQIKSRLSLEKADVLSLCFLAGLAISSVPRIKLWGFDSAITLLLISSALALTAFGQRGSVWTSVTAVMWVLKGGDTTVALSLIAGGILGGMLENKRGGVLLGFVVGDMLMSLFLLNTPALSLGIINLLLGCFYPILLKKDVIQRLKRYAGSTSGVNDLEMNYISGLRDQQSEKLMRAARTYNELSKVFAVSACNNENRTQVMEAALSVCRQCKKSEYCLNARKSDTVIEIKEASEEMLLKGNVSELPSGLKARCIRPVELIGAMNEANERTVPTEEDGASELFKSVSVMLEDMARDVRNLPEFDERVEREARDVLSARLGTVTFIACRKTRDSHELTVSMRENRAKLSDDICNALEAGTNVAYRCLKGGSDKNGGYTGTFAPMPKYAIEPFALRQCKKGNSVCGDSFTFGYIGGNRFLGAISDGAGSGERAKKESESTLALLESFSETHLSREKVFKTMNRLMLLKGESEDYSTVDVAELDLDGGIMYWTKIGAVPGYILRGGRAERLEAGALPMGIVSKINPVTQKRLIQEGDVIVMVSDGISDRLNVGNEDGIREILEGKSGGIKEICHEIMEKAGGKDALDDMTVLAMEVKAS